MQLGLEIGPTSFVPPFSVFEIPDLSVGNLQGLVADRMHLINGISLQITTKW